MTSKKAHSLGAAFALSLVFVHRGAASPRTAGAKRSCRALRLWSYVGRPMGVPVGN
jgi:hypothetical protein